MKIESLNNPKVNWLDISSDIVVNNILKFILELDKVETPV